MRGRLLLLLLGATLSCSAPEPAPPGKPEPQDTLSRRAALLETGVYAGDDGWTPLVAPHPGEWLFSFPERGQTFEEYVASNPLRRAPGRERIVLQPLTPLDPDALGALEAVSAQCALFFTAGTELAAPAELPDDAYRPARGQYDAEALLEHLAARRPDGLLVYAGVCDRDLMIPELNFLFGKGRFRAGLGVYSFARFSGPGVDRSLYLQRAFKLLTHEIGHGFGLTHCIYFRCVMNGTNSLHETDGAPLEPCPVCLRKLKHSLGFDVKQRWTRLAALYDQLGMPRDAEWLRARIANLEKSGRTQPWTER